MSQTTTVAGRSGISPALRALLSVFALPAAGILCFGVVVASGIPSDRVGLLGLTIATGTLILMVVAVDRTRPRERRNLLLSLFTLAYVVRFVVTTLIFYIGDSGYHPDTSPVTTLIPLTPEAVTNGMLAALLGYAMLLAGFSLPFGRIAANGVRLRREWSAETTLAVAMLMLPLGWSVVLASQLGLIPLRAGTGVLGTIASGSTYGIALIALCYQRYRSRLALLLLAAAIPPTMLFNFFTGSKLLFLMPLLMIAIVHIIVTRRVRVWWIVGGLAALMLLYPIAQEYRAYAWGNKLNALQVLSSPQRAISLIGDIASIPPGEYLESGAVATGHRLDGLGILSVIVRDSGTRVPYQYGETLRYIPLSFVPRLLWPGKPLFDTGQWVNDHFGPGPQIRSSTGSTWLGELYFNFGWAGLLVGMALAGMWLRFLQDWFLRTDATIPALLAGVVTILTLAHTIGGSLVSPTSGLIFNITPILLTHLLVRWFTAPPLHPPPPM